MPYDSTPCPQHGRELDQATDQQLRDLASRLSADMNAVLDELEARRHARIRGELR